MENTALEPADGNLEETMDICLDDTADVLYPSVTEEILSIVW